MTDILESILSERHDDDDDDDDDDHHHHQQDKAKSQKAEKSTETSGLTPLGRRECHVAAPETRNYGRFSLAV